MLFDIHSHFSIRDSGLMAISFDDPTFVRSEMVLYDKENGLVEVLLQGKRHPVGHIPVSLAEMFAEAGDVILSAERIDGSVLELKSRLIVMN